MPNDYYANMQKELDFENNDTFDIEPTTNHCSVTLDNLIKTQKEFELMFSYFAQDNDQLYVATFKDYEINWKGPYVKETLLDFFPKKDITFLNQVQSITTFWKEPIKRLNNLYRLEYHSTHIKKLVKAIVFRDFRNYGRPIGAKRIKFSLIKFYNPKNQSYFQFYDDRYIRIQFGDKKLKEYFQKIYKTERPEDWI